MSETKDDLEQRMVRTERFDTWRKFLGDSRPQRTTATIQSPMGELLRIYCLNCGKPGGAVTANVPYVLYLCDPCAATHGGLPLPEIPPDLVRP